MDVESYSKYLKRYAGMTFSFLLVIVAFNAIVDPLWVYHKPWLSQSLVKDQRQGNPGIARFASYDAVVIGNSLTENLSVTEIESRYGWRPLKLSIAGSTPLEQRLVLDQALATGQVCHVLWSVDMFSLSNGPDHVCVNDFPYHLYQRNVTTFWKYLLSGDTLIRSFKVISGAGPKDFEARHAWHSDTKVGPEPVLAKWRHTFAKQDFLSADRDLAWQSVEKHLLEVIRLHPEVHFHFMIPPYSALYRVSELVAPGDQFTIRMQFKRDLARTLLQFPNVEVFDFETAYELTHDINRYTDLIHYDFAASSSILLWMSEGRYRLTADLIDEQIRQLEDDTYQYATALFSSDNPFRDQLRLEEFNLRLPATSAAAAPLTDTNPQRIAEADRRANN